MRRAGALQGRNSPGHLTVYLSGRCNMLCAYCYSRDPGGPVIRLPDLLKSLETFLAGRPPGAKISFLGGEPLLHKPLLLAAVRFIRKKTGQEVPVTVFTNGVLLDAVTAAFLRANHVKTVLSMDGNPAAPGYARKGPVPDLSALDLEGMSASVVITPAAAAGLEEKVAWLYRAGFRSIGWAPDIKGRWDREALKKLSVSAAALKRFYLGLLRSGLPEYELANAYEAIAAARGRQPERACTSLTLAPDGEFYPCDKLAGLGRPALRKILAGGRAGFFSAAAAAGFRPYGMMCPVGAWAAAGCPTGKKLAAARASFGGQAAVRRLARRWLVGTVRAAMRFPAFNRRHNIR